METDEKVKEADVVEWLEDFRAKLLDGSLVDETHTILRVTDRGASSGFRLSKMIEIIIEAIKDNQ